MFYCAISGSLSTYSGDDLTVNLEACPKHLYRAPFHSAMPTSADSSYVPEWMTHFCFLLHFITVEMFYLKAFPSHIDLLTLSLPTGERWTVEQVIVSGSYFGWSLLFFFFFFGFLFVPCLWTEHKRKANANSISPNHASGILVLETTLLERNLKTEEYKEGRKWKTSPYNRFPEDFSPSPTQLHKPN